MLCLISLIEIETYVCLFFSIYSIISHWLVNAHPLYLFPFSHLFLFRLVSTLQKFFFFHFSLTLLQMYIIFYNFVLSFPVFCLAGRSNWRKTRTSWHMRSRDLGSSTSGCRSGTDEDQRQQYIKIALQLHNSSTRVEFVFRLKVEKVRGRYFLNGVV